MPRIRCRPLTHLLLGFVAALPPTAATLSAAASEPGQAGRSQVELRDVDLNQPGGTGPARRLDDAAPANTGSDAVGLDLRLPPAWDIITPRSDAPLEISVENAVFLALSNNRALSVQQLEPLIRGTFEAVERAQFDPMLFADATMGRSSVSRQSEDIEQQFVVRNQTERLAGGIRQQLATGTDLELSISTDRAESNRTDEQFGSRAGISLTQALLRGGSRQANLARLRQSELDSLGSVYELRGFSEALVAEVETAYWDYVLADSQTSIFQEALNVAEQQLEQIRRRIAVGDRPETEETAARAEVALRRQGLINARAERDSRRLRLLQLINPPGAGWAAALRALDRPTLEQEIMLDPVEQHVTLGQRLRPDLNQARLQVQRGELEVIRTRRGVLPRLDLFVTLGKTGFSDSFGNAWRDMDGSGFDYSAGLRLEAPLGSRAGRAERQRAGLTRQQSVEAVANLAQLAALDVQLAWLDVDRTREQINATAITRSLQEEVLRAEQARFTVGSGTALAVSQAQRDLLESRLDEVEAAIRYRQALTNLHRQSGTLLVRRGIDAPGSDEVVLR